MPGKYDFKVSCTKTYSLEGLSRVDIELINRGLEEIGGDLEIDLLNRKCALVETLEDIMNNE